MQRFNENHGPGELVILRLTVQVIATIQPDGRVQLRLVGRCEPDHQRMSRARSVRQALGPGLPAAWRN